MAEPFRSARGLDRLINFSDAVVAIAITLLVLPLTDLLASTPQQGVFEVLGEHADQFAGFVLTFGVTAIYWTRHHALFERVGSYDLQLVWLNMLWLMFVVLLPFSSGLVSEYGMGHGNGVIYGGTLACLSLVQGFMTLYLRHRRLLLLPGVPDESLRTGKAWIYAGFFVSCAAISVVQPTLASWLLLLLFPLGRLTR